MAGPIPSEVIDEVRRAADIVEVVNRKTKLTKKGKDFWGVCPFHGDTDPSMKVDQGRGTWHCFGCGAGGSVFNFVMLAESLPFPEAVRSLAASFKVNLPEQELTPEQTRQRARRAQILHVLAVSCKFFEQQLHSGLGRKAHDYLFKQRELSQATVADFVLGYAPDAWDALFRYLSGQGVSLELATEAGLIVPREKSQGGYDRFRNRVMFPIRDVAGRTISFGGRTLGDDPAKYVNGPETDVFRKSATLYNLDKARQAARSKGRVLLVEGYFDVVTLAAHGLTEAMAPMGTALTATQVRLLAGLGVEIVLVFDGDDAGRRAATRGLNIFLEERLSPLVLWLPKGEDPDSLVRGQGVKALERMLAGVGPLLQAVLDDIIKSGQQSSPEGKSRLVAACGEILGAVKDPVTKSGYIEYVADKLSLNPGLVAGRLGQPRGAFVVNRPPVTVKSPGLNSQGLMMELALSGAAAARAICQAGILEEIDQVELMPIARALMDLVEQGHAPELGAVLQYLAENPAACATISRLAINTEQKPVQVEEQIKAWRAKQRKSAATRLNKELALALREGDLVKASQLRQQRRALALSLSSGEE